MRDSPHDTRQQNDDDNNNMYILCIKYNETNERVAAGSERPTKNVPLAAALSSASSIYTWQ